MARVANGIDGETLGAKLLAEPYKTFIVPGSAYGLPQHIRVGVGGGPEVNLDEGLRRLSACLRDIN